MSDESDDGDTPVVMALTVPQAARALNLSTAKMYELVSAGEVRSVKIGRSRRVPVSELDAYLAALLDA